MKKLKEIFLEEITYQFEQRLQNDPKELKKDYIDDFSDAVIEDNKEKIDNYLKANVVTINNFDKAVKDVIDSILIPASDKMKIQ